MRLNLGSGNYLLDGWTNVDAYCEADVVGDVRELEFSEVDAVNMSHLLEHFSWRETAAVLDHLHSWMRQGARLTIEVPDIERILALGTKHPLWFKYVFGDQSTPGEAHLAGFTPRMLIDALTAASFRLGAIVRFRSEHKGRETMPCLKAWAYA